MLTDNFNTLQQLVTHRRSIKPSNFNGQKLKDEEVLQLIQLADFAPNHGNTEPWKFIVYAGNAVQEFCKQHAALYKASSGEQFMQSKYDKLATQGDKTSHIIIAVMERGALPKIPVWEEMAAASCAVQNILLGAESIGAAAFWSTGGMATSGELKSYLNLKDEDAVIGLLYLGYADNSSFIKPRHKSIETKLKWIE